MADRGHPLVDDYLRRLDATARALPGGQRAELVADIRAHLTEAAPPGADESTVRTAIDRLGPPEDIVVAAVESSPERRVVNVIPGRRASLWLELSAALLMTVGSLLVPGLGWLVGAGLMWASRRLRLREKVIGTLLVPGGIGGIAAIALFAAPVKSCFSSTTGSVDGTGRPVTVSSCSGGASSLADHLLSAGLIAGAVAALVVPVALFVIARRRADAETHVVYAPTPA